MTFMTMFIETIENALRLGLQRIGTTSYVFSFF